LANPNDHIIEQLFQAILQFVGEQAPESTFYRSMQAANLPIDNRMLANFIIQDFPWPIGVELRRLFSGDLKDRDKNRVDQILKVAEKLAQLFSSCLLVQLWDESKNRKIELSKDFQAQIQNVIRPSFGSYVGLIRATHNLFEKQGIKPFLEYNTPDFKFNKLMDSFNNLVTMRNEDRHYSSEMDCQEGEEILTDLLVKLAVFSKYKLVTIKEIKVVGPKLKPVQFNHAIRMLNSQHEDFNLVEQAFDEFSESHSVLLMREFTSTKEYLNLSPFVVDTSTLLENQKVPGIKNGIYLFHQIKDDKYIYTLTSAPEQAVFNDLPNFEYLRNQFEDFLRTLEFRSS
jgi:hypothetical protein